MENNLDEYFQKGLTDETRATTLKQVDELLKCEAKGEWDWAEKLKGKEYQDELDKL